MDATQSRGEWVMIGVPTSAGAHHAGQDRAPAALRAAGIIDRLRAAGVTVSDAGDVPGSVFAVDHDHPRARNLAAVVSVARGVADAVAREVVAGRRPLVVGGDCTITVGVVAGVHRVYPNAGLAYLDGERHVRVSLAMDVKSPEGQALAIQKAPATMTPAGSRAWFAG